MRSQQSFSVLRNFHNWIKLSLLKEFIKPKEDYNLLDLACGKGGDIHKWKKLNVKYVRGYDIDRISIEEANRRFRNLNNKNLDYIFTCKDLSTASVYLHKKVDTVTCFFALHYFFKDPNSINNIISQISKNIKKDGYFIFTAFDEENLQKINYIIDNEKIKVTPISLKSSSVFNRKINVYIKGTVLDTSTVEYIIHLSTLMKIMKANGLELVKKKNFIEYFQEWKKDAQNLSRSLSPVEKKLSFLNCAYVFKKI